MHFDKSLDKINASITAILERGIWLGSFCILILLPIPYLLGVSNFSSVLLGLLLCAVALVLGLNEPKSERQVFLSLFTWSYLVRICALLTLSWVLYPGEATFLGPDGSNYFKISLALEADGLPLPKDLIYALESYHVAPYYLFASVLHVFDGDLFALQLLNSGMGALVSPLIFSWCRSVAPRYAVPMGVIVAMYPSLIALSAKDLLKDPSVLFFTVLAIWSLTKILQSRSIISLVALTFSGAMSLTYLHLARFYLVVYFEVVVIFVLLLCLLRRVPIFQITRRSGVALFILFIVAEVGPMALGWPSSFGLFSQNLLYTLGTPSMRYSSPGLFEVVRAHIENSQIAGWLVAVVNALINVFRKLYGPFVWILPEQWNIVYIFADEFLLYPGMLIWYSLLPFIGAGFAIMSFGIISGREKNPALIGLWAFIFLYFVHYLSINLSVRHREVMVPLLLVPAFVGVESTTKYPRWRKLYCAYWVSIICVAAGHLVLRKLTF